MPPPTGGATARACSSVSNTATARPVAVVEAGSSTPATNPGARLDRREHVLLEALRGLRQVGDVDVDDELRALTVPPLFRFAVTCNGVRSGRRCRVVHGLPMRRWRRPMFGSVAQMRSSSSLFLAANSSSEMMPRWRRSSSSMSRSRISKGRRARLRCGGCPAQAAALAVPSGADVGARSRPVRRVRRTAACRARPSVIVVVLVGAVVRTSGAARAAACRTGSPRVHRRPRSR